MRAALQHGPATAVRPVAASVTHRATCPASVRCPGMHRSLLCLAVILGVAALSTRIAGAAVRFPIATDATSPAVSDGWKRIAYMPTPGRLQLLVNRSQPVYALDVSAGCSVAPRLIAIGGGKVLFACDSSGDISLLDIASRTLHNVPGVRAALQTANARTLGSGAFTDVGAYGLRFESTAYHEGTSIATLDWRTGASAHEPQRCACPVPARSRGCRSRTTCTRSVPPCGRAEPCGSSRAPFRVSCSKFAAALATARGRGPLVGDLTGASHFRSSASPIHWRSRCAIATEAEPDTASAWRPAGRCDQPGTSRLVRYAAADCSNTAKTSSSSCVLGVTLGMT